MEKDVIIIKVRRGINGFRYAACDRNGYFLRNFDRLSDIRAHWKKEIKCGRVVLIRELDQIADTRQIEAAKEVIEKILYSYKK